jgi:aspartyl aminopeptidase
MPDPYLDDLAAFVVASPSSFHAAATVAARLDEAGFVGHDERDPIEGTPGGHYVVRDGAIVAWHVPAGPDAAHAGVPHRRRPHRLTRAEAQAAAHGVRVRVAAGRPSRSTAVRCPTSGSTANSASPGAWSRATGEQVLVATPAWLRVPQVAPHLDRARSTRPCKLDRQPTSSPSSRLGVPTSTCSS